jgi:hypothetical protein
VEKVVGTWTILPKSGCGSGPGYAISQRPFGVEDGIPQR